MRVVEQRDQKRASKGWQQMNSATLGLQRLVTENAHGHLMSSCLHLVTVAGAGLEGTERLNASHQRVVVAFTACNCFLVVK